MDEITIIIPGLNTIIINGTPFYSAYVESKEQPIEFYEKGLTSLTEYNPISDVYIIKMVTFEEDTANELAPLFRNLMK